MSDQELVQLVCAFRLVFPDVGLVLSTRESAKLRDGLIPLGITMMSAGSHTEPGGYTGAGKAKLHRTQGHRIIKVQENVSGNSDPAAAATEQFAIADTRSAKEIANLVRRLGYEPVWKDWDPVLAARN
jgi:2-iminoacetate synthase